MDEPSPQPEIPTFGNRRPAPADKMSVEYAEWTINELERLDKMTRRDEERVRLNMIVEGHQRLAGYHGGVSLAYQVSMELMGFHRHKRGEWRRVRGMATTTVAKAEAKGGAPAKKGPRRREYSWRERQRIIERAHAGDGSVREQLRRLLASKKWGPEIVSTYGSPALRVVLSALVYRGTGEDRDLMAVESGVRSYRELKRELTPKGATPLERLLAERVAVLNVVSAEVEADLMRRMPKGFPREVEALSRAAGAAHRRLLSSIRALEDFRKVVQPRPPQLVIVNQAGASGPAVGQAVVEAEALTVAPRKAITAGPSQAPAPPAV